ncbi:MAG: LamG-like jellyroll fold domain-containing protein [Planctomycetota bacterium]|nr:LamG-like jellyroll fold domain-containing protein [Planctomycetota bacterium]
MRITLLALILSLGSHAMAGVDDFVASWSFDEGSGGFLGDETGSSQGVIHGASWIEGISGGALSFDGLDDYVEITDGTGFPDFLGDLEYGTIAMWFRFDTMPEAGVIHSCLYVGRENSASERSTFHVEIGHNQVNSKLYWTIVEPEAQQPSLCYDSSSQLTTDTWYHYVLVVTPTGNTGYLNGVEMDSRHYNFGSPDSRRFLSDMVTREAFWFGKGSFAGSDQYLEGAMDEVRVWDRSLDASEIQLYFESFGYEPPEPPEEQGVFIETPVDGDTVAGSITISGRVDDLDVATVRIRIGDNPPITANGTESWLLDWDSTSEPDGSVTIRAITRECQSCPSYSDMITVDVDNIPPAVVIESPLNGDVAWNTMSITGSTTQSGTVMVQVDDLPAEPANGTNPWSLDVDATSLGTGVHTVQAILMDGSNEIDQAEAVIIVSPESPPVPDCEVVEPGTPVSDPNLSAPSYVDTCGKVCWPEVTFHVIGHSENFGLAEALQARFDEDPPDGRTFTFVDHAIGGQETWEWITPGSDGWTELQSILDQADGPDAPPQIALILTSNVISYPSGDGDSSDENYALFMEQARALVDILDDGGQGVVMTYLSAHRMKPDPMMPSYYENLAVGDIVADADAETFPRLKPGPELHDLTWCQFPEGYAEDWAHPNEDGTALMADAWHTLLMRDLIRPGDVNGDGAVSVTDVLMMLEAWGVCPDDDDCPADFDNDGVVGVNDILLLLSWWT